MAIRITGMNSGLDTESLVTELVSAYRAKGDKYVKAQTKLTWKQDAWKTMSAKISSFRSSLDSVRYVSSYNMKTTSVSNSTKASVTASNSAVIGTQTLEVNALAKSGYLTGGKLKTTDDTAATSSSTMQSLGMTAGTSGEISLNGKQITISSDTTISDVISKLKDAGVNASFDATNQRIFVSSTASGKDNDFTLTGLDTNGAKALTALGLNVKPADNTDYEKYADMSDDELADVLATYGDNDEDTDSVIANFAKQYQQADDDVTKSALVDSFKGFIQTQNDPEVTYNDDAVRIYGQDASIKLNGAVFTSTTNAFSINGLTINALALTDPGETLSLTTSTDAQGIYDKIKDFLSDYNTLINSMTSAYNAESSSDYEPLTDDEKDSMSDTEIEKWEEKGKSGILRRDDTLSSLMSVMTTAMAKSYTIDGKTYALSTFGIKTLGITAYTTNTQNAYHIDGDEDDENTSSNTDKLLAAINSDPDGVAQFFQKLTSSLYDSLTSKMSSTSLRSYGSFYNDKEMATEYSTYTKTISNWETKVSDLEETYYKKFAAMESALATLQSSSSALSGLLG
jgi:flagellar hook-associated protein 2